MQQLSAEIFAPNSRWIERKKENSLEIWQLNDFYLIVANIVIVLIDEMTVEMAVSHLQCISGYSGSQCTEKYSQHFFFRLLLLCLIQEPIIDNLNAKMPENILSCRSNNFVFKIYDRMHQIARFSYNTVLFGHLSFCDENRQEWYTT